MIGGGREASQPDNSTDQAPQAEDLHQVLDRLRNRIEEVAAWAEHASHAATNDGGDETTPHSTAEEQTDPVAALPDAAELPETVELPEAAELPAALGFLRGLARSGAVAGGVFSNGSDVIDLTEPANTTQVPESGLVALLNLVPSDTVLEVRTRSTELRAARLGDDAFAVEVVPGSEQEVDDWLASLLPSRES